VTIQDLAIGDLVMTLSGIAWPVRWVGKGSVLATRGRRSAATPVTVCKSALADNVPNADLRMTKAHALYIDEVLIPVEFLVNHPRTLGVAIHHIELRQGRSLIPTHVESDVPTPPRRHGPACPGHLSRHVLE
jgi:hypothetical protein